MSFSPDLPESWAVVSLGDVVDYGSTKKAEPREIPDTAWILELEDIEKGSSKIICRATYTERRSKSTKNFFQKGEVLYGKLRPYLNKVVIADSDGFCTTEIVPIAQSHFFESRYLFYWLRHPAFLDYVNAVSHGLNMPRLGTEAGRAAPFILAPLPEQKRIADKLDALLTRVDATRARLDRIPTLLKRFRQSVLAAATSGQLTEDWRAKFAVDAWKDRVSQPIPLPNGFKRLKKQKFELVGIDHDAMEIPPSWAIETVASLYQRNVLLDFADGNHGSLYPRKEEFGNQGALFLTATQMDENGRVFPELCPRLVARKAELLTKGWAENGDVLLSHNATVGRVGLLEGLSEKILLGTSVTFYRFNEAYVCPSYAKLVFLSPFFQDQLSSVMSQTTRDQVPITKQVNLNFICAPIDEQLEIVRRVDSLFALADEAEARYSSAIKKVEKLTPALLGKAFRGELVPQDPSDEPADQLLARIRASAPEKARPKKSSKKTESA